MINSSKLNASYVWQTHTLSLSLFLSLSLLLSLSLSLSLSVGCLRFFDFVNEHDWIQLNDIIEKNENNYAPSINQVQNSYFALKSQQRLQIFRPWWSGVDMPNMDFPSFIGQTYTPVFGNDLFITYAHLSQVDWVASCGLYLWSNFRTNYEAVQPIFCTNN